jgi:hypothetical protein
MPIEIKRMWEGGPLRRWSDGPQGRGWTSYQSPTLRGFAGSYVCEACQASVAGVYYVPCALQWLCAARKKAAKITKMKKAAVGRKRR